MKTLMIITFFTVFFGIYTLGNWYLYNRGMQALPTGTLRSIFPWLFWGIAFTFIIGQFLERGMFTYFSQIVTYIGSFWLVFAWYAMLMIVAIDLIRVANHFLHFIPANFISGTVLFSVVGGIAFILVVAGAINAYIPKIKNVEITIDKPVESDSELKVVMVSDIHMGFIIGNNRTQRLINRLNTIDPDLILLVGDIVDHNPKPVIRKNLGKHFSQLNPQFGIYAVTGNHEYIGTPEVSIDYLSQYGINYVRDSVVVLPNGIAIIGRNDREGIRFDGKKRKRLNELTVNIDKTKPVFLMDHQPVEYGAVESEGIDLMVSGHTHKGQFWPFGYITRKVFELDYGYKKKGNTNFYVSSGYGTWGPPVRIASRSEIVVFNIKYSGE